MERDRSVSITRWSVTKDTSMQIQFQRVHLALRVDSPNITASDVFVTLTS